MVSYEIQSDIEAIEKNPALCQEPNFAGRAQALDYLEFNILDRIEGLRQTINPSEELSALKQSAERVKRRLEKIDDGLFRRLLASIRNGECVGTSFEALIDEYVGHDSTVRRQQDEPGYDSRDVFINSLLLNKPVPPETKERTAEMVCYQQTPARILFELVEKGHFTGEDVFYDLGSGLGHAPILAHLLSGVRAKGVEFEPAYCDYASACAAALNLAQVEFINAEAREVDYSDGTVFFMYTPFVGGLLQEVLEKLRREARRRRLRLFTFGPCTSEIARQSWLERVDAAAIGLHRLGAFKSLATLQEPAPA